jgi:hypothetical protein
VPEILAHTGSEDRSTPKVKTKNRGSKGLIIRPGKSKTFGVKKRRFSSNVS